MFCQTYVVNWDCFLPSMFVFEFNKFIKRAIDFRFLCLGASVICFQHKTAFLSTYFFAFWELSSLLIIYFFSFFLFWLQFTTQVCMKKQVYQRMKVLMRSSKEEVRKQTGREGRIGREWKNRYNMVAGGDRWCIKI